MESLNKPLHVHSIQAPYKAEMNNMNRTEVALNSGKSLVLNCSAGGEPEPTYTWRKEQWCQI